MMPILTMLLQVSGKMLYLPTWYQIFGGKIWCQNVEGRWHMGGTSLGLTYLLLERNVCQMLGVGKIDGSGGGMVPAGHVSSPFTITDSSPSTNPTWATPQ